MEREEDESSVAAKKTGEVKVKDLVPCFGVCCFIVSLYIEIPDCFGAVCENSLCCLNAKTILCKSSKEPGALCKCCSADIDIVQFSSCCMSRTQFFCIELRSSIPPTKQIPCLCTICFLTFCFQYKFACKCCAEVRNLVQLVYVSNDGNDHSNENAHDVWVELVDPSSYKLYYLNKYTGVSQWERPEGF